MKLTHKKIDEKLEAVGNMLREHNADVAMISGTLIARFTDSRGKAAVVTFTQSALNQQPERITSNIVLKMAEWNRKIGALNG